MLLQYNLLNDSAGKLTGLTKYCILWLCESESCGVQASLILFFFVVLAGWVGRLLTGSIILPRLYHRNHKV